jgi:hypothetical protein
MRFALVVALAACSHQVLIRSDDTTYRRAIAHYQHTRQLVAESLASDDEQTMFLQAEAMFRYRFEPPGTGFASYLAQAGASLIDLPVLESLAGSLDLYSIRQRMGDAAVQIWETLLASDPKSPLVPLALYRLGWAYRNTLVSGLPGSSDDAFDALATKYAQSPLAPLAKSAKQTDWKSEGAATAWSIVPGLGQMYAGEYRNGAVRLSIALASAAMLVVPIVIASRQNEDLTWRNDWPLLLTSIAGATILTIDYSNSYQDALRAVLEYNERSEHAFEDAHPEAP